MSDVAAHISALEALGDQQFLDQFADTTLDKSHFNHLGHLRAAWLYLQKQGLEQACISYPESIIKYATALGAPEKFNRTLTIALLTIIHARQQLNPADSWQQFVLQELDLTTNAMAVLTLHYSSERLFSAEASAQMLQPDLAPLP